MEAKQHREFVSVTLAEIVSDLKHIKEVCNKNENWLSKLNSRVRKTENSIPAIQGVGAVGFILFTGFITYIVKAI